ncbi:MAG: 1-deoxy-D-xylulose-5-phosphate reductoisomerase [Eubacteriales bacterium]|nr:1-deoxy-D-xylulose-5-phosphate reductoisomerase [Eubacteriales bacterium]
MRSITILGSTGSIGRQALDVCARLDLYPRYLSCAGNVELLAEQIIRWQPEKVAVRDEQAKARLESILKAKQVTVPEMLWGESGLATLASYSVDRVVVAVSGFAALKPVYRAIMAGNSLALANKECVVVAGDWLLPLAQKQSVSIYPVDSEHSAIWQCLAASPLGSLRKIYLTGSGGPFLYHKPEELTHITPEEALVHPLWNMGAKISIDSATMFNKGLELIEAMRLFGVEEEQVEILIHPEGVVHSGVEFHDGSILAQMGRADMRLPIQLALTWPQRVDSGLKPFNFFEAGKKRTLTFLEPDPERFPALSLARQVARMKGYAPLVMNAANEVAVQAFLQGKLGFTEIYPLVEQAVRQFEQEVAVEYPELSKTDKALDSMIKYDAQVRVWTDSQIR